MKKTHFYSMQLVNLSMPRLPEISLGKEIPVSQDNESYRSKQLY
jgi:hypothetical protein